MKKCRNNLSYLNTLSINYYSYLLRVYELPICLSIDPFNFFYSNFIRRYYHGYCFLPIWHLRPPPSVHLCVILLQVEVRTLPPLGSIVHFYWYINSHLALLFTTIHSRFKTLYLSPLFLFRGHRPTAETYLSNSLPTSPSLKLTKATRWTWSLIETGLRLS